MTYPDEWWGCLIAYLVVFVSGGLLCVIAQLLIIKTKLTPARILVMFLIIGMVLETVGVYDFLFSWLQAGISVPIIGFGAALAKGSIFYALEYGFVGAFAGGLIYTAFGIGVAVVMSYLVSIIFSPKSK